MQAFPSHAQRCKFDAFVLKVILDKDVDFLKETMLDRSVITPELISVLASDENQRNTIIGLLYKPISP